MKVALALEGLIIIANTTLVMRMPGAESCFAEKKIVINMSAPELDIYYFTFPPGLLITSSTSSGLFLPQE